MRCSGLLLSSVVVLGVHPASQCSALHLQFGLYLFLTQVLDIAKDCPCLIGFEMGKAPLAWLEDGCWSRWQMDF